ncbi:hypothetical protein GIS00_26185 [Nakamurella sp. YIM 132087]|uniref:Uncharacterized protein n=1 Tax=Nakamurella alba TaxID=2665158 RepID=A0A7K1FTE2_9ACTN|nr:DUF5691 domain-containing protein [Nakamurella alba]MTD17426.1 hypothetical protein [Nakamurella alba]
MSAPAGDLADLAVVAALGLDHRHWEISPPATAPGTDGLLSDDPATALLEAAVLADIAARAGAVLATVPVPTAPVRDPGEWPEWSTTASAALMAVLGRSPGLLADLLRAAARAGFRAPAPLLPDLLDGVLRRAEPARAVLAVLGSTGRRLLPRDPAWAALHIAASVDLDADNLWHTGSRDERRAHLMALRRHDPARARELLAAGWPAETAPDRSMWLDVLRIGLSGADEEFLEAALDDRSAAVRAGAAGLLGTMPGSRYVARAIGRAGSMIELGSDRLQVLAAGPPDDALFRDGVAVGGIRGGGITSLLAAVPPSHWPAALGLPPAGLLEIPVDSGSPITSDDLHEAWRVAAVRFADPSWSEVLLDHAAADRPGATVGHPLDGDLARIVAGSWPATEAADRTVALLRAGGGVAVVESSLSVLPGPWPAGVAEALPEWLADQIWANAPVGAGFYDLLARRLPTDGPHLALWQQMLDEGVEGPPAAARAAVRALDGMMLSLGLRRAFLAAVGLSGWDGGQLTGSTGPVGSTGGPEEDG